MTAIRMYIEKFGREVLIDKDHPLAVAQLAAQDADQAEPRTGTPAAPKGRGKRKNA